MIGLLADPPNVTVRRVSGDRHVGRAFQPPFSMEDGHVGQPFHAGIPQTRDYATSLSYISVGPPSLRPFFGAGSAGLPANAHLLTGTRFDALYEPSGYLVQLARIVRIGSLIVPLPRYVKRIILSGQKSLQGFFRALLRSYSEPRALNVLRARLSFPRSRSRALSGDQPPGTCQFSSPS